MTSSSSRPNSFAYDPYQFPGYFPVKPLPNASEVENSSSSTTENGWEESLETLEIPSPNRSRREGDTPRLEGSRFALITENEENEVSSSTASSDSSAIVPASKNYWETGAALYSGVKSLFQTSFLGVTLDAVTNNSYTAPFWDRSSKAAKHLANTRWEWKGLTPLAGIPGAGLLIDPTTHGNLNPINRATTIAHKLANNWRGVPKLEQLPDQFVHLGATIDTRLANVSEPARAIIVPPSSPPHVSATPPNKATLIKQLQAAERSERRKLIHNATEFASLSFLHGRVFRQRVEHPREFYNKFIDNRRAYYKQLTFFKQLIAKLLLPIIRWIIGLFITAKEKKVSVASNIKESVMKYMSKPGVARKEINHFVNEVGNHFDQLRQLHIQYYTDPDTNLPLQKYLELKLEEAHQLSGVSSRRLYNSGNDFLIQILRVKSRVPIFGPIIDGIINRALKPIIHKADPIKKVLQDADRSGGIFDPNSEFMFASHFLLANQLEAAIDKIDEETEIRKANGGLPKKIGIFESPLPEDEQEVLTQFYKKMMRYLPLEKLRRSTKQEVAAGIALQDEPYPGWNWGITKGINSWKWWEDCLAKWNIEIEKKNLEPLLTKLGPFLFEELSNPAMRLKLWIELLKIGNQLFNPNPVRHTPAQCLEQRQRVEHLSKRLTDAILTSEFCVEHRAKEAEKKKRLGHQYLKETRQLLKQGREQLSAIHTALEEARTLEGVDYLPTHIQKMLQALREFSAQINTKIGEAFEKERAIYNGMLRDESRQLLRVELHKIQGKMVKLLNLCDLLSSQINLKGRMEKMQNGLNLLKVAEDTPDTLTVILPGISHDNISAITQTIKGENEKIRVDLEEGALPSIGENVTQIKTLHRNTEEFNSEIIEKVEQTALLIHTANIEISAYNNFNHIGDAIQTHLSNIIAIRKAIAENPPTDLLEKAKKIASKLKELVKGRTISEKQKIELIQKKDELIRLLAPHAITGRPILDHLDKINGTEIIDLLKMHTHAIDDGIHHLLQTNRQNQTLIVKDQTLILTKIRHLNKQLAETTPALIHYRELALEVVPHFTLHEERIDLKLAELQEAIDRQKREFDSMIHELLNNRKAAQMLLTEKLDQLRQITQIHCESLPISIADASAKIPSVLHSIEKARKKIVKPQALVMTGGDSSIAWVEKHIVKKRIDDLGPLLVRMFNNPIHLKHIVEIGMLRRIYDLKKK